MVVHCKAALAERKLNEAEQACRQAVAAEGSFTQARSVLLSVLLAKGAFPEAFKEARAARKLAEDDGPLAVMVGVVTYEAAERRVAEARFGDAVALLERGAQGDQKESVALAQRYLCAHHRHDAAYAKRSAEACARFLEQRPAELGALDAEVRRQQARAHLVLRQIPEALGACQGLERSGGERERTLGIACGGEVRAASGDCEAAVRTLEPLLKQQIPGTLAPLGRCYLALEPPRTGDALRLATTMKKLSPKDPEGYLLLARVHLAAKRFPLAVRELELARKLDSPSLPLLLALAEAESALGKNEDAARALDDARRLAPEDPSVVVLLGIIEVRRGRAAQAIEPLARAAQAHPTRADLWEVLGLAQLQAGKAVDGLRTLEGAHRLDGKSARILQRLVAALQRVGVDAARAGRLDDAERLLVRAQQLDGRSPSVLRNLGIVRLLAGQAARALEPLASLRMAQPEDRETNLLFGRALASTGKLSEAEQALDMAVRAARAANQPLPLAECLVELSSVLIRAGKLDPAIVALAEARSAARADGAVGKLVARNLAVAQIVRSRVPDRTPDQVMDDLQAAIAGGMLLPAELEQARFSLALAQLDVGKHAQAIRGLEALASCRSCRFRPPFDQLGVEFWIGYARYRAGRTALLQQAAASLARLESSVRAEARPRVARILEATLVRLASDQYEGGEPQRASASLKQASKLHGDDEGLQRTTRHNLAVLDLLDGNVGRARTALEQLGSSPREALVNLGIVRYLDGDLRGAVNLWRRSRSKSPQVRGWIEQAERFLGETAAASEGGL